MFRRTIFSVLAILALCVTGHAASEAKSSVGVVNFSTCMTESKVGQQEQASFESLNKQMSSLLEDTEKQINEIAGKFNDPEYMDGLSPEAEEELKMKYQTLSEEMGRYQNQRYQVLQQANMKIVQGLGAKIQEAAQIVAGKQKLNMVMNKEACFFVTPTLDVTQLVIAEMDKIFDQESKNKQTAAMDSPNLEMSSKK